jgi:hypothetical protein
MTTSATITDELLDQACRKRLLEEHGRLYAQLGFAIAFTNGIEGDDAKRVSLRGWDKTQPLGDPDFAAGLAATRGHQRNPVVVLGASNLIGVDVDSEAGRQRLLAFGRVPNTVVVTTGNGYHLWYRPPAPTRVTKIEFTAGHVMLVHGAGYLIVPPALHPSGTTYRFEEGHDPWSTPIAVFPAPLLERLEREQRASDEAARHSDAGPITEGERHAHLLRLACAMRRVGAGEPEITGALLILNTRRCVPPKDEHLVRATARDVVARYAPGERS